MLCSGLTRGFGRYQFTMLTDAAIFIVGDKLVCYHFCIYAVMTIEAIAVEDVAQVTRQCLLDAGIWEIV